MGANLRIRVPVSNFVTSDLQPAGLGGLMTKVADDCVSKKRGGGKVGRYPLVGMGILGFSAVGKLVPWWGALLLGAFTLMVALVQSVMPQESSDRAGVIREFLIFLLVVRPSLPRLRHVGHTSAPEGTSDKEIR
jgi:hypothetical protein